jgi:hypothetical protein
MHNLILAFAGSLALAAFPALSVFLRAIPERHFAALNSLGGGAGLAYVFLYLLFELATEGAPKIHGLIPLGASPLETLFTILLGGLAVAYIVLMEQERTLGTHDDHRNFSLLFLVYNVLAGAGVADEATWGIANLIFFVAAIGIHLLFNELFLVRHFSAEHTGRWRVALSMAPLFGCGFAVGAGMPSGALYIALALVAGATITTILQRELPRSGRFRAMPFVAGVLAYAGLIFATWRF